MGIRCEYLHSDIDAIGRVEILGRLRKGGFDALIGVNLLREGLDLPEVTRVAILDADKEGFLRSETSLVQTAGRCARNTGGKVILYADNETPAIAALQEITRRHREKQAAYNQAHGIEPRSVKRAINEDLQVMPGAESEPVPRGKKQTSNSLKVAEGDLSAAEVLDALRHLEMEMRQAAEALEFERAALLRDEMRTLRKTYGLS
jgi:excinuclease ABC subunit B